MYDKEIPVEFVNKNVDEISSRFKVDQQVNIGINLAGREWEGRYFVNIRAWRLLENDAIDEDVEETIAKPKETDDLPF